MSVHSYSGEAALADKESRKKQITAQRQGQILKAALEVFSRKGYAAATIPEIAELAGVAVGTIYIYYPSKRELFVAVIKNLIITTPLLNLIDEIPQGEIDVVFKKIMQNRLDLIKKVPMTWLPSLMGEIIRDPEVKALFREDFLQPFLSQLETGYSFMIDSNKFRRMEPAVAVRAVGGTIIGFLMVRMVEGESSPLERLPQDKVTDDLANFMLHGLLNEAINKKAEREK